MEEMTRLQEELNIERSANATKVQDIEASKCSEIAALAHSYAIKQQCLEVTLADEREAARIAKEEMEQSHASQVQDMITKEELRSRLSSQRDEVTASVTALVTSSFTDKIAALEQAIISAKKESDTQALQTQSERDAEIDEMISQIDLLENHFRPSHIVV